MTGVFKTHITSAPSPARLHKTLSLFFFFFPETSNKTSTIFDSLTDPFCLFRLSSSGSLVSHCFLSLLQIDYLLRTEGKLSKYLFECEYLTLPEPGCELEDGLLTPDSVLEPPGSMRTSSSSSAGEGAGGVGCRTLACTATTEFVRKKRSSVSVYRTACRPIYSPVSEISAGMMNRRKGTPQRSPLY